MNRFMEEGVPKQLLVDVLPADKQVETFTINEIHATHSALDAHRPVRLGRERKCKSRANTG